MEGSLEPPHLCPLCHSDQNPLYCPGCLHEGIVEFQRKLAKSQAEIDGIVHQSSQLLAGPSRQPQSSGSRHLIGGIGLGGGSSRGVNAWRELRADVAARERRCAELRRKVAEKEAEIVSARRHISTTSAHSRRATLASLQAGPSPSTSLQAAIKRVKVQQRETTYRIVHARQVLVREAVTVFGVWQRSGTAGQPGEWEIAGLVLPSPERFRLHPSANINAAISHTVHLLSLITRYLSITLPFAPTSPPPLELPHVGRPVMKATLPFVSTTRWRDKHVLWMSSTASLASKLKTRDTRGGRDTRDHSSRGHSAQTQTLQASMTFSNPALSPIITRSTGKHRQFLTSFALLAFSIAYLAWSQGVQGVGIRDGAEEGDESDDEGRGSRPGTGMGRRPPSAAAQAAPNSVLISATSLLQLIDALSLSPTLGERSHDPGGVALLPHMGFGMDVAKVVQTVLGAEEGRWGAKGAGEGGGEGELSEGWDLLDAEGPA
ncbi:hypothetical protein IAT38_005640 [Cryptococcus sp. DSM 104549]